MAMIYFARDVLGWVSMQLTAGKDVPVRKNCGVCHEYGLYGQRWSSECPKCPNPKPFGLLLRT
ncbi:hypothetical protein RchiOBHm_Chr6g0246131 [Rosa chinensis]|uniref:Uncharacterized protein n=1 Tax=Rosa chinensis TaxID=74649 RepID=A0A2P6PJG3_ROSCH|nr:hypothetical protein RchiOBHm_Chr6g0246131 [Rosa chinensis]